MLALSIHQPWAYLIAAGHKDVENRGWHMGITGRIYIHASKKEAPRDNFAYAFALVKTLHGAADASIIEKNYHLFKAFGAIIGEATIVECRHRELGECGCFSMWHEVGQYGFYLKDPVLYDRPIPYRGQLGFFEVKL